MGWPTKLKAMIRASQARYNSRRRMKSDDADADADAAFNLTTAPDTLLGQKLRSNNNNNNATAADNMQRTVTLHSLHIDGPIVAPLCPAALRRTAASWSMSAFQVFRSCGGGRHSCVYSAACRTTGTNVALKVYHWFELSPINMEQVQREVTLHSNVHHPNAIPLYGAFADGNNVVLVMEYAIGGDVYKRLHRHGRYSEREAVSQVVAPVLSCFQHIHSMGYLHRDLKPENLLVGDDGTLKVADFGLSVDQGVERPVTRLGTLDYMAPEVLACPDKSMLDKHADPAGAAKVAYGQAADVWGIGVLAHELLTGRPPFEGKSREQVTARIAAGRRNPLPEKVSDVAKSFINSCLQDCATQRLTCRELLRHPWIQAHRQAPNQGQGGAEPDRVRAPRPTLLYAPHVPTPYPVGTILDATKVAASVVAASPAGNRRSRLQSYGRQPSKVALAKDALRQRTASTVSSSHNNSRIQKALTQYLAF